MHDIYDLVIEGGTVYRFDPDTHGVTNLGIKDGRIMSISDKPLDGKTIINAQGMTVAPGFIDFHSHVDGKEFSAGCVLRQGATTTIGGERNLDGQIVRDIENNGFLLNHGFYISHSFTLRQAVGIEDPYRSASIRELKTMVRLAEQFLSNGAYGIHFGIEFVPGTSEDELYALSEAAKNHNKCVLVHLRNDGIYAPDALNEAISIAMKTGVKMHILHLHYMSGFGRMMKKTLDIIDDAVADGCDITVDTGLYDAFPSCAGASILDEGFTKKYRKGTKVSDMMVSSGVFAGRRCNYQMLEYLRKEFPNTLVIGFTFEEEAIKQVLKKEYTMVSTNAADGPHYNHVGHPETSGTFPRLFRKYVRESEILSMEDALRKITYQPASRFNISGKGNIKVGYDADITIFDQNKICDKAGFVDIGDPNATPEGISHVIINGKEVISDGKMTKCRSVGKLLMAE